MQKYTLYGPDYSSIQEEGHYEVILQDFTLDFYYRPSDKPAAYIFSPGWINRLTYPYPYFQRMKWLAELDGVGISLADPTQRLSDKIQIGWFLGTAKIDFTQLVSEFIIGLLAHLNIRHDRTLFFGSSAGGYASLSFAARVTGAKALAINPKRKYLDFTTSVSCQQL